VVKSADLYDPPIIKRGQRISVIARRGNIEISVDARAVEDGKVGESIRVENISTHKVLRGKVMNEKAVLVGEEAP
jgi:flagella basal body P-ring formation protein FlgA